MHRIGSVTRVPRRLPSSRRLGELHAQLLERVREEAHLAAAVGAVVAQLRAVTRGVQPVLDVFYVVFLLLCGGGVSEGRHNARRTPHDAQKTQPKKTTTHLKDVVRVRAAVAAHAAAALLHVGAGDAGVRVHAAVTVLWLCFC